MLGLAIEHQGCSTQRAHPSAGDVAERMGEKRFYRQATISDDEVRQVLLAPHPAGGRPRGADVVPTMYSVRT
jgi:hypothetical protein